MDNDKVYIVLADGHVFEGKRFGSDGDITGELVFTTGMCGYIETLTDPSYYGQIVMQTFPLIGNYGYIGADAESRRSFVSAYIVREKCDKPSNFRCEEEIDKFLKENNIPGVYGVDTREITRIIRESGVMNARICADPAEADFEAIKAYRVTDAVKATSQTEISELKARGEEKHHVVLIDYGAKRNIARELSKRGCRVTTVPYNTSANDILAMEPSGIMLSNGAGNPEDNTECIEELRKLIGKKPIFGICLGHQLLALAMGAKTMKLKYGHRGVNQPVKNLNTGRTYISSQNHGYAVVDDSIAAGGGITSYINANDLTNEGVDYPQRKAFSVQFHPEACSGPLDTRFLFDKFINMMEEVEENASE